MLPPVAFPTTPPQSNCIPAPLPTRPRARSATVQSTPRNRHKRTKTFPISWSFSTPNASGYMPDLNLSQDFQSTSTMTALLPPADLFSDPGSPSPLPRPFHPQSSPTMNPPPTSPGMANLNAFTRLAFAAASPELEQGWKMPLGAVVVVDHKSPNNKKRVSFSPTLSTWTQMSDPEFGDSSPELGAHSSGCWSSDSDAEEGEDEPEEVASEEMAMELDRKRVIVGLSRIKIAERVEFWSRDMVDSL
ncbi:hypothetical protein P7C70_g199, partial [Phenoliferia sp. Uapishka_3]